MTFSAETIDVIVAEVVRRLRDQAAATNSPPPVDAPAAPESAAAWESAADPQCLRLDCRLVTLTVIKGRLRGVRRLSIPAGAVVTPSVRDELRQRGISIQRKTTAVSAGAESIDWMVVSDCRLVRDAVDRLVTLVGLPPARARYDLAARDRAVGQVVALTGSSGGRVVVCSEQVAWLVWQLNRQPSIRALSAHRAGELSKGIEQIDANVWVTNPRWIAAEDGQRMFQLFVGDAAADAGRRGS